MHLVWVLLDRSGKDGDLIHGNRPLLEPDSYSVKKLEQANTIQLAQLAREYGRCETTRRLSSA